MEYKHDEEAKTKSLCVKTGEKAQDMGAAALGWKCSSSTLHTHSQSSMNSSEDAGAPLPGAAQRQQAAEGGCELEPRTGSSSIPGNCSGMPWVCKELPGSQLRDRGTPGLVWLFGCVRKESHDVAASH